jgi:hypothetical protein
MTHRVVTSFQGQEASGGDAELMQQLQLYKTPAIIRDMKQVFFYVEAFANTTTTSFYDIYTNRGRTYYTGGNLGAPGLLGELAKVPPYYCPIGTKRKFRLWEQMNSLMDVRVPKDKYVFEIHLVEAQVESDPSNWIKQRDYEAIPRQGTTLPPAGGKGPNDYNLDRKYTIEYQYAEIPADPAFKQNINKTYVKEATKTSIPQPLFVRIPQLSNNQAYNWTVVNNGAFNSDKNHGVVIRHGDIDYQEMDIEFGHLTYKGTDDEYQSFGSTEVSPGAPEWDISQSRLQGKLNNYQDYEYMDYNWEWPNATTTSIVDAGPPPVNVTSTNVNNKYVAPASRNTNEIVNENQINPNGGTNTIQIQGKPLKTNQQVSNISFRCMVKLIHMF